QAHELKVVVYNDSDFAWAESFAEKMRPGCTLFLQPEWSKSDRMLPKIIDYVKNNPKWEISLQVHKFMDIP
ncbi:MAG: 7-carboxy-7-deazaguanine synthase QueE, partial [Bacteroidia bacterium]|nr:7-carboxy-7-deazaguanine synthase QueE [Bacteroidia bacterium]